MKSDILISIYPKYLEQIRNNKKNFEFRPFVIHDNYINVWVYETRPIMEVNTFMVVRKPIKKLSDSISKYYGLGNEKFIENINNGRVGYEIVSVSTLSTPISLKELKNLGLYNAPQNYLKIDNYPKLKQRLSHIDVNKMK